MTSKVYPLGSRDRYRYVVVFPRFNGQWLLVRHGQRDTWETAGGHIEPGETPMDAARRELYEETGATQFDIWPAFDYWAADEASEANGRVFVADIRELGPLPDFEMAETRLFHELPEALTYPGITPLLFSEIMRRGIYTRPSGGV